MNVGISLGPAITCTAYEVYLWPNPWKDPHLRAKSDHILKAVLGEHQASGASPAIIAGDSNNEPIAIPALALLYLRGRAVMWEPPRPSLSTLISPLAGQQLAPQPRAGTLFLLVRPCCPLSRLTGLLSLESARCPRTPQPSSQSGSPPPRGGLAPSPSLLTCPRSPCLAGSLSSRMPWTKLPPPYLPGTP